MKTKNTNLFLIAICALSITCTLNIAQAVDTDGTATFTVQTINYNGGYDPKNISVVWVVNSSGTFVKTLCRHANSRINYLYKWKSDRGTYTEVDGVTSATTSSQPQTHTVVWDCRDRYGAIVPDGTYYFRAEYTSSNAQGPYMASNCSFVKGTASVSKTFPNYSNASGQFANMSLTYVPDADIAITAIAPSACTTGQIVPIQVTVANQTLNPATFTVTVNDLTPSSSLIGTQIVTTLAGMSSTTASINWNTTGISLGSHQIQAIISTLDGETDVADNTSLKTIVVSSPQMSDIAVTGITPATGLTDSIIPITVTVANVTGNSDGPIPVTLRSLDGNILTSANDTIQILEDEDDAEEKLSAHSVSITSTDLELTDDSGVQEIGLRFRSVNIPQNATVTAAYIQFTGKLGQNSNGNPISLSIQGQDADNTAIFTTASSSISTRPHTSASVGWSPPNWTDGENGPAARTPNVKTVVQEIVDRAGWVGGNSLVLLITGSGLRRAWSHDGSSNGAAQLTLEWFTQSSELNTTIASLAASSATNVIFNLNTAGFTPGSYRFVAVAGPMPNESNSGDNTTTNTIVLRDPVRDLAIESIITSPVIPPNVISNITVIVTNKGDQTESAITTLNDITGAPVLLDTDTTAVAAHASVPVTLQWNTAGAAPGYHTLQASVQSVPNETNTGDNSDSIQVIIASAIATNMLVATDSEWKYLDQGLDITGAPWRSPTYYDGFWASGPSPLGFALANIATTISYGPDSGNRYPTTYFRREFILDFEPMSIGARMMRADGAVLYLNGAEIVRHNMPAGSIGYNTLASSAVTGPAATQYYEFSIASSNLVIGRNLLSAELHLSSATREAAGFSVELFTVNPSIPPIYAVNPANLLPAGSVQPGDTLTVAVTLTNDGNTAAPCIVLLKDSVSGAVLASQTVPTLALGETTTVQIAWPTFGVTPGGRTLQALTVCNGVTNLASIASAPVTIVATDFTPRTVAATGSIGGRCNAVAVTGRYVYLGCGATLECWDAINPAAPVRVGAVRLPGIIEDLVVSGTWVFAATGAAGVQIVDASAPSLLVHQATFDSSGHARRLHISANLLYVADVAGGIRILNVASPATPVLAGAYQTTGPAQSLTSVGSTLLVMNGQLGMQSYDVSNPAAIALAGACRPVTAGLAIDAVSGSAWATDANNGLFLINTTTPAAPVIVTSTLLPASGRSIETQGSAVYAAAGAAGLLTLNAITLTLQDTYDPGDEAMDVALSGTTLYVAAGFAGCQALDITNPMQPQPLGIFHTGARPVDAAAHGSMLFVAADEAGLQIHSLQNLALPTLLGSVTSINNARCVAVAYPLIYVADGLFGLKIFNASNPEAPTLIGSYVAPGLSHIRRLVLAGNRAVLTDGAAIHLLNIENPSAPLLLATHKPGGFVFDLTAIPGEVYAACGGAGLKALRMDSLGLDAVYTTPGPATGVTAISNLLHVACGPAGWQTLNIANAANPVFVHGSPTGGSFGAVAAGPLLYLADGTRTAQVINVSAPLSPVTTATFPSLTQALRVRAVQGLMLTAEGEAGMAIFNASPGDINLNGIPDSWEQQIVDASITTNGPIRSVLDVNQNAIGPNGFPYYQSYLAGLSPTDPNSVLAISSVTPQASGGQFVVQWYSVPGKSYTLYKSTNLADGFTPIPAATGILATESTTSYTDTVTTTRAFYMVVLAP